jgi:hypothetical protein
MLGNVKTKLQMDFFLYNVIFNIFLYVEILKSI